MALGVISLNVTRKIFLGIGGRNAHLERFDGPLRFVFFLGLAFLIQCRFGPFSALFFFVFGAAGGIGFYIFLRFRKHHSQMRGDSFPFAVRVAGEIHRVGNGSGFAKIVDDPCLCRK